MTAIGIGISLAIGSGAGGTVLGPELLTNGNFAASGANWSVTGNDATHIATFGVGSLRFQSDTASPQLSVSQSGVATLGKTYRVTVVCSAWTSGVIKVFEQSGGILSVNGVGTFSLNVVDNFSASSFVITRNGVNVDLTLSSVSLREVLA